MVINWNLPGGPGLDSVESWFYTVTLTPQYQEMFDALFTVDVLVIVLDPKKAVYETSATTLATADQTT